ncbi:MAG: hypothetical protein ACKOE6_12180 [Flammeovirgaceae bacterium]
MSRKKKSNSHYNVAVTRLASIKSISPGLDLGNGLSAATYEAAVLDFRQNLDDYNMSLSVVDSKQHIVDETEKKLRDMSERMLTGVASKFGKNSDEYEKAGGTRKSEKRRPLKADAAKLNKAA